MVFQQQQILNHKYQLERQLGRTATGHQTWLAIDTEIKRSVVIKLLAFNPQMRWEELKLFEREAQILQHLDHPCIPQYYDYFDLDKSIGQGVPWFALVQQYIPGLSLQECLERNYTLTTEKIRDLAQEVLDILIYLHQLRPTVLHRDLKPSNLILGEDERIYLIDFGAVQAQAAVTGVTFTIVGTVGYAPLEQFWGRAVEASDLYALGATLVHLLTGKSPADLPQKDARIQFRHLIHNGESSFIDWLEKMTELSLEKRFSKAITAKQALMSPELINFPVNSPHETVTNSLIKHYLPFNSIKIDPTGGMLKINIPPGGLKRFNEFFNVGCAGLLGYYLLFVISLVFLGVSSGISGILITYLLFKILLLLCETTEVAIDRSILTINHQLGAIKYNRQIIACKTIKNVFIQRTGSIFQVAVQSSDRLYSLGGALSQEEATWLTQEIKNYLELR